MKKRNADRIRNRSKNKEFHGPNQDRKPIQYLSDDWMYRPLLNINTRTDYDGNKIEAEWMSGD